MKRNYFILAAVLVSLAFISGILTSKISFIGRVGVNFFYKHYQFFKIWWQAALVCLALFLTVTLIIHFIDRRFSGFRKTGLLATLLFVFLGGLYLTYSGFRKDLSYRLLGERFHLGIYLWFIGCCLAVLFYMVTIPAESADRKNMIAPPSGKPE